MLKFSASILSGEAPVYDGYSLIALTFQRPNLSLKYHLVADSTHWLLKTLNSISAMFSHSHIPTSCPRRRASHRGVGAALLFTRIETVTVPLALL